MNEKKKNNKNEDDQYSSLTFDNSLSYITFNDTGSTSGWTTVDTITTSNTLNYTIDSSNTFAFTDTVFVNDPYLELEQMRSDQEADEKLREENPSLQDAYEQYQLIKKLVQEEECDKYFHDKMKVFKK